MKTEIKSINSYISYIPACENPLSADVGIIKARSCTYFFDVGRAEACLDYLHSVKGRMQVIISHFHADHIWWLTKHSIGDWGLDPEDRLSMNYERPCFEKIYIGKGTEKYIPDGTIIKENLILEDETLSGEKIKLRIIPMPSSHSTGALALEVNDEYLFLGDSTYCRYRKNNEEEEARAEYNVQKLKAQIDLLRSINADKCLIDHDPKFIRPKKVILRQLESVYERRTPGENVIYL